MSEQTIEQVVDQAIADVERGSDPGGLTGEESAKIRNGLLTAIYVWHMERIESTRRSAYLDGLRNAADDIGAFNTMQHPRDLAQYLRGIADRAAASS